MTCSVCPEHTSFFGTKTQCLSGRHIWDPVSALPKAGGGSRPDQGQGVHSPPRAIDQNSQLSDMILYDVDARLPINSQRLLVTEIYQKAYLPNISTNYMAKVRASTSHQKARIAFTHALTCSEAVHSNLNKNQSESALGYLRRISFHLQLEFKYKSIRICSGLPQTDFLSFLIRI